MRDASSLILHYFLLLLFLIGAVRSNVDKVRLRVSVRKDSLEKVPSCQHSLSQVELVNLHSTEPIQIHGIHMAGESAVLHSADKQQKLSYENVDDPTSALPQQVRVSRLPSGSLSLGPGQVAIVPVTFLPHYPHILHSPTAAADAQFFEVPRHNNREWEGGGLGPGGGTTAIASSAGTAQILEVSTKVVVDTSRGRVQLPITASSLRHNDYGLPDVIYFEEDSSVKKEPGVLILDSDAYGFNRTATEEILHQLKQQQQQQKSDCFDVYISNPSQDDELDVTEVLLSRPELMTLQVQPEKMTTELPFFVVRRLSTPSQVHRMWSESGPLKVEPSSMAYVATACMGSVIREDESLEEMISWEGPNSLGFLQIRTSKDTLLVSLERKQVLLSESESNSPILHDSNSGQLQATPSSIDFHLLSSETPTSTISIGLTNTSPKKVTIMRATVGVDLAQEDNNWIQRVGLQLNVSIGAHDDHSKKPVKISSGASLDDAIWLTCSVDWDALSNHDLDSLTFAGTLVIRATSSNPRQWSETVLKNPNQSSDHIAEVPYSITVVQGKLGIMIHRTSHPFPHLWAVKPWKDKDGLGSVSSIFFPQRPFEVRGEVEGDRAEPIFSFADGIDHKLRIFTNIEVPGMTLTKVEVIDKQVHSNDSVCKRFEIDLSPSPEGDFPYAGFTDIGMVHVHYNFPDIDNTGEIQHSSIPAFPTTCYLIITTTPQAEVHQIPLIVYPGQLDVTATQSPPMDSRRGDTDNSNLKKKYEKNDKLYESSNDSELDDDPLSTAVVGFDVLLSWLKTTTVGAALKSVLASASAAGYRSRSKLSDVQVLGEYIYRLCRRTVDVESSILRPILVKVGAIEQGEMETSSFYLTNHNPIPLLISIDVGEVEGMSISLGRVMTRGRTDENNLLNHFPLKKADSHNETEPLVPDGTWRGHPLKGLRKFLMTDEVALSFFSLFPYRDAISLSEMAVKRQPLLGMLYNKYAFGEFHRAQLPIRFGRDGWSRCDVTMHPARYSDFNNENNKLQGNEFGPLILSGDTSVLQPLNTCWDKQGEPVEYPSDGTYIIIPPGGVGRFELRLHAPPSSYLKDDITRFLATGLVLSTDHGEVLPIFVTFEALQGKLQVSHVPSVSDYMPPCCEEPRSNNNTRGEENITVIRVPAGLFQQPANATSTAAEPWDDDHIKVTIPSNHTECSSSASADASNFVGKNEFTRSGVSLYVTSSFSREVRLLQVESCNPWFEVELQQDETSGMGSLAQKDQCNKSRSFGFKIGTVSSKVFCGVPEGSNYTMGYQSFYQCALNWLTNRVDLQPRGCGLFPTVSASSSTDETSGGHLAEQGGVERAIRAFERALLVSRWNYGGENGEGPDNGAVDLFDSYMQLVDKKSILAPRFDEKWQGENGFIAPGTLNVFAEAWDAWRVVSDFGLRVLTSSLRATIEYDSTGEIEEEAMTDVHASERELETERSSRPSSSGAATQNLSVSMRDLAVETVLSTPKLFDCARAMEKLPYAKTNDDESPSVIEFPPALVANVVSLTIPLRNPTSVPVRVRIAAAPSDPLIGSAEDNEFEIDDGIRNRYIQNRDAPYVQNGKTNASLVENAENLWWEGDGAYYVSDAHGDLIRSHHNIRIRAGAGAHVSLINPSLHSSSALLVGCGVRCGIRDDPTMPKAYDIDFDPKVLSPIGASAAAGVTLVGRKRSNLPQVNVMGAEEPHIAAGASFAGSEGPAAFAIPFSALHEIEIPPYGEAEVGPVLFRPPGRYSVHGCGTATDSDVTGMGAGKSEACALNLFQSMVFLENSLTGLERILLQGKALWERVFFLDPVPEDEDEAFGDIEFRNGRSALVFSGSRNDDHEQRNPRNLSSRRHHSESSIPGTVVKEVVVHNGGDVSVRFGHAYLSDTARLVDKRFVGGSSCTFGSFRLLDCWDIEESVVSVDGVPVDNMRNGFSLAPGQNRSLFIEHIPNCVQPEEFVALNIEFHRDRVGTRRGMPTRDNVYSLSRSGQLRFARANNWKHSFRERKIDLLVGYDMSEEDFRSCRPAAQKGHQVVNAVHSVREFFSWKGQDPSSSLKVANSSSDFNSTNDKYPRRTTLDSSGRASTGYETFLSISIVTVLSVSVAAIARGCLVREEASIQFVSRLNGSGKVKTGTSKKKAPAVETIASVGHSNWSAAFRCLARADPTSSELQTLGREQVRQVVLGRYRSMGVQPPQGFNSAGVFLRERSNSTTSPRRHVHVGREGTVGGSNDRARRLSDAIFQNFSTNSDTVGKGILPCGLGWRAAFSRGLIDESSMDTFSTRGLKANKLLDERSNRDKDLALAEEEEDSVHYSDEGDSDIRDGEPIAMREFTVDEVPDDANREQHASVESVVESGDVISTSNSEGTDPKDEALSTKDSHESSMQEDTKQQKGDSVEGKLAPKNDARRLKHGAVTDNGDAPVKMKAVSSNSNSNSNINSHTQKGKAENTPPVPVTAPKRKSKRERDRERARDREREGQLERERVERENKARNAEKNNHHIEEESSVNNTRKQGQTKDVSKSKRTESRNSQEKSKTKTVQEKAKNSERRNHQRDKRVSQVTNDADRQERRLSNESSQSNKKKRAPKADRGSAKKQLKDSSSSTNGAANNDEAKDVTPSQAPPKVKKQDVSAEKTPVAISPVLPKLSSEEPAFPVKKSNSPPLLRPPPGLAPPPGFSELDATLPTGAPALPLSVPSFGATSPVTDSLPPVAQTNLLLNEHNLLASSSGHVVGTPVPSLSDPTFGINSTTSVNSMQGVTATSVDHSIQGVLAPPPVNNAIHGISGTAPPGVNNVAGGPASDLSVPVDLPVPSLSGESLLRDGNNVDYMAGFDVMDFLDSILNDGSAPKEDNVASHNNDPAGAFLTDAATLPLSSDPWATERQSRAAAYGISFEDSDKSLGASPVLEAIGGSAVDGVSPGLEPLSGPAVVVTSPVIDPLSASVISGDDPSLSLLLNGAIPPPLYEDEDPSPYEDDIHPMYEDGVSPPLYDDEKIDDVKLFDASVLEE